MRASPARVRRQYAAYRQDPSLPAPSETALRRQLNAIKREEFPWMLDVTKNAPQMAIMQLGQAFSNFLATQTIPLWRLTWRMKRRR